MSLRSPGHAHGPPVSLAHMRQTTVSPRTLSAFPFSCWLGEVIPTPPPAACSPPLSIQRLGPPVPLVHPTHHPRHTCTASGPLTPVSADRAFNTLMLTDHRLWTAMEPLTQLDPPPFPPSPGGLRWGCASHSIPTPLPPLAHMTRHCLPPTTSNL
eukprot:scaffold44324_cov30-Tisochrysis_lutea.AAC.6